MLSVSINAYISRNLLLTRKQINANIYSTIVGAVRQLSDEGIRSTNSNAEVGDGQARWLKRKMALVVSFVGSNYAGLQMNFNPKLSTIETELEKSLHKVGCISDSNHGLLGKIGWSRSSRTDKGVHCARMVISAKLLVKPDWLSLDDYGEMVFLINEQLPPDIRVISCVKVNQGFRARDACTWREYEYILPVSLVTDKYDTSLSTDKQVHSNDEKKHWCELPKDSKEAVSQLNKILKQMEGSHRYSTVYIQ